MNHRAELPLSTFAPALFAALSVASAGPASAAPPGDAINAVVGDASWIAAHGAPPPAGAPETDRIRTHLLHVERALRAAPVDHLDEARRARRGRALDRLHAYALEGRFPRHDSPRGRTPRFVDHEGRLCAVGDLIATTEGRAAAERVNARHEYDLVLEMHEPALDAWAAENGFTLRELATIQPAYGFEHPGYANDRGITWGLRASAPVLLSDVRGGDGVARELFALGGAGEAHLGWEWEGLTVFLAGGASGHAASPSGALVTARTTLGARYTFDVGDRTLAPFLGGSVGLLLASLDAPIAATALASIDGGVQLRLVSWLALDLGVALEGALPGDAFADAIAWLSPFVGLSIHAPGS